MRTTLRQWLVSFLLSAVLVLAPFWGRAHPRLRDFLAHLVTPVAWLLAHSRLVEIHSSEFLFSSMLLTWLLLSALLVLLFRLFRGSPGETKATTSGTR